MSEWSTRSSALLDYLNVVVIAENRFVCVALIEDAEMIAHDHNEAERLRTESQGRLEHFSHSEQSRSYHFKRAQAALDALRKIQFNLLYCTQAAGSNACPHLKDAIEIVNEALE